MRTRNVLFLIIGTIAVSVLSALITVRLTQNETKIPGQYSIQNSEHRMIANGPTQIAPLKQPTPSPPPPPPSEPHSIQVDKELSVAMASLPPASANPIRDTRKPMSTAEVKRTLLKNAPACHQEYEEICTQDTYSAEHPLACLRSKRNQISNACSNQIKAIAVQFEKECGSDITRFCAVSTQRFACLKEKYAELTSECKKNILEYSRR